MTLMDPLFSWCSGTLKGTNIPTKREKENHRLKSVLGFDIL